MSTMQKVLLLSAATVLMFCVGGGLYGYYGLWPRLKTGSTNAVAREVAFQVEQSMENALAMHGHSPCEVRLASADLDISTYTDASGGAGLEITNNDAAIVNGQVELSANGIAIILGDMSLHGEPVVEDGEFDLTNIETERGLTSFLVNGSGVESGFVDGVNAGLASARLVPTSVEISDGQMIIGCQDGAGV